MKKVFFFLSFLISILFGFSSCKNFLNAGVLKEELEAQIKLANAEKVSVRISVDKSEFGKVTPQDDVIFSVEYPVELEFKINSDYVFDSWSVIDRDTRLSVEDVVVFENETLIQDGIQKIYKVQATLKRKVTNLLIRPMCHALNDVTAPEFYGQVTLAGSLKDLDNGVFLSDYNFEESYVYQNNQGCINRVNKLFINCSAKEEDSSKVSLCVYEYPIEQYGNDNISARFSENPFVTEYEDFVQTGEGLFSVKTQSGDYIVYNFQTAVEDLVKIVLVLKDSAGNICSKPITYYVGKDTDVDINAEIELADVIISKEAFAEYSNFTIAELLKKFCTYKVLYKEIYGWWNTDEVNGMMPDHITYSYEVSSDNENFTKVNIKPEKEPVSDNDYSFVDDEYGGKYAVYAALDISSFNRAEGLYIRLTGVDQCGNEKKHTVYLPGSSTVYTCIVKPDNSKMEFMAYHNYNFETSVSDYYFYATDTDGSNWNFKTDASNFDSGATEYYVYCLSVDQNGKAGTLSELMTLETSKFSKNMLTDFSFDLSNMQDIMGKLDAKLDVNVSYELEYEGKNSGTANLKIILGDGYENCSMWMGVWYSGLSNMKMLEAYAVGNVLKIKHIETSMLGENNFIMLMGFDENGDLKYLGSSNNLITVNSKVKKLDDLKIESLVDNVPPEIQNFAFNPDMTGFSFKVEDINTPFNSPYNYMDEENPGCNVPDIKVYYTSISKQRSLEEIKRLSELKVEAKEEKEEDSVNSTACWNVTFSCDISELEKTLYYFYFYCEDNSSLKNYCIVEKSINLNKLTYNDYKKGGDTFIYWYIPSGAPKRKVYNLKPQAGEKEKYYWTPAATNEYEVYGYDDLTEENVFVSDAEDEDTFSMVVFEVQSNAGLQTYSYPYYYLGQDVVCDLKNIIVTENATTIVYDQRCFSQLLFNKVNYGSDVKEWEIHTPESQKVSKNIYEPSAPGVMTMKNLKTTYINYDGRELNYVDDILNGYYYCEIVYFADGTSSITSVKRK